MNQLGNQDELRPTMNCWYQNRLCNMLLESLLLLSHRIEDAKLAVELLG